MIAALPRRLVLALSVFCATQCSAQEIKPALSVPFNKGEEAAFTREQALRYALTHSPVLSAAQERINAAQGSLQSARALPPMDVAIGPFFGGDAGVVPFATQRLEINGRRSARTGVARRDLTATQRDADSTHLDVIRDVNRAYYDLAQSQQVLLLTTEIVGIALRIQVSVKLQVGKGQLPEVDLIKAETELARTEGDVARAQADVTIRGILLSSIMGRDTNSSLTASDPITFAPITSDQATLLTLALQQRSEVAAGMARVLSAKENIRLQRTDLRPDVSVSVLQNTSVHSPDFLTPRSSGVGVSLIFPFGDTGQIRGRVRQMEAQAREQEKILDQVRLAVKRDVASAYTLVKMTEYLVKHYEEEILPKALVVLQKVQSGYERGGTTILEYLEAQRTYRNTRSEYLISLGDNARARTELDRAVGATVK